MCLVTFYDFLPFLQSGNNIHDFLFVFLDKLSLPKRGLELKGKNLLQGVQTFLLELTPTEKGGKTEMVKLLPVHLKTFFCGCCFVVLRPQ